MTVYSIYLGTQWQIVNAGTMRFTLLPLALSIPPLKSDSGYYQCRFWAYVNSSMLFISNDVTSLSLFVRKSVKIWKFSQIELISKSLLWRYNKLLSLNTFWTDLTTAIWFQLVLCKHFNKILFLFLITRITSHDFNVSSSQA